MVKGAYQPSKKEIVDEIMRCGKDPIYFITTYAKITHPLKGLIPFKLYKFQEQLIKDLNNNRFNVVLKARQLGISTLIAAYAAWMMMFYRDRNILVVATKEKTAANLVKKVKAIVKYLPDFIRISQIKVNNVVSFE
jgi:hypothetical protein